MTDHNATQPAAIRHLTPAVAVRLVELTRHNSESDEEASRRDGTRTASLRPTSNNHSTASSRPSRATNTDDDPQAERLRRLTGTIAGTIFQDLIAGSFRPVDPGPPPASDAAIAALERDPPARDPSERCPICLEALCSGSPPTSPKACESAHACTGRAGDPIDLDLPPTRVRMPCGHDFHEDCLLQWVRTHHTCPVCRYELERGEPKDEGHSNPLLATIQGWREAVAAEGAQRVAVANVVEGGADAATIVADGGSGPSLALPAGLEHLGIPRTTFAITARRDPDGTFSFPQMASFTVDFPSLHLLSARGAPPLGGGRGGYGAPPRALLRRLGVAMPPSDDDSPPASPSAERAAAAAEAQLRALSVPELKRRLGELGVDVDDIVEKRELVNLLLRHSARPERRGSSSGVAGSTRGPPGPRNARRSREAAIDPLLRQAAASSTRRGRSDLVIESADRELDSRARRDIDDNTRDGPRSRLSNAAASLSQAAVWLLERAEASRARAEALFQSAIAPESPQGGSSQVARSSPVASEALPLAPLPPEARPTALRSPAASSSRLRDRASRSSDAVGASQDEQPGPSSGTRPKRRRLNH